MLSNVCVSDCLAALGQPRAHRLCCERRRSRLQLLPSQPQPLVVHFSCLLEPVLSILPEELLSCRSFALVLPELAEWQAER